MRDSILRPELDWEQECIEAAAAMVRMARYTCFMPVHIITAPQQISVAVSSDGIHFERMSDRPFLENGGPGSWNECESGHPYVLLMMTTEFICFTREITTKENRGIFPEWKSDLKMRYRILSN